MPRKVLKTDSAQTGNISRVSTMKWIDALKVYNAGKMWCVPRKGTPEYDEVRKIMNRTKPEEVEKRNVERREKAAEQLKALDTRKKIEERRKEEASRDAVAVVKDTKSREVVDRIADINKQIEDELKTGFVSFEYDLGWNPPDTKAYLSSGGDRGVKIDYQSFFGKSDMIDVEKIKQRIKELGTDEKNKYAVENLNAILTNLKEWKPMNAYYGYSYNYNTKEKNTDGFDGVVKQALDDYQAFADEVNKRRTTPIRNIAVRHRINPDGSRTLQASWNIQRGRYAYPYFVRQYQILPVFKFKEGATIAGMEEQERKEKEESEAKEKAMAEKKEAKEKDPIYILTKKIEALEKEKTDRRREQVKVERERFPDRDRITYDQLKELGRLEKEHRKELDDKFQTEINRLTQERSKLEKQKKKEQNEQKVKAMLENAKAIAEKIKAEKAAQEKKE